VLCDSPHLVSDLHSGVSNQLLCLRRPRMSRPLPRLFLLVISLAAPSLFAAAPPTPSNALLVLSKQDHTLAIVDPATLHVLARVPVGEDPHEVVASADGRIAY